jgi:hypothetical protein
MTQSIDISRIKEIDTGIERSMDGLFGNCIINVSPTNRRVTNHGSATNCPGSKSNFAHVQICVSEFPVSHHVNL